MSRCLAMLSLLNGGGYADWDELFKTIDEWGLDEYNVVNEASEHDINALYHAAYTLHANDVKEWVKEIVNDLDYEEDIVGYDFEVDNYNPAIAENYMCTTYDDTYELWDASDKDELVGTYLDDLVDFLVDEGIVVSDKKDEDEEEFKERVKKLIKGEDDDDE